MKPWLKKIDAMKAEATEKSNKLTASRFRQGAETKRLFEQGLKAGKSYGEASSEAVKKTGMTLGSSQAHFRGWFILLSLDESDDDLKWRWHLSVSKSETLGAGPTDLLELKEIVERLGGKFDDPYQIPERDGTKAIHWLWDQDK